MTKTAFKKLKSAWKALPEDLLERAFGDGTKVRVFAGGRIATDEYCCE